MNRLSFLRSLGALLLAPAAVKAVAEEPEPTVGLPEGEYKYALRYRDENGDRAARGDPEDMAQFLSDRPVEYKFRNQIITLVTIDQWNDGVPYGQ